MKLTIKKLKKAIIITLVLIAVVVIAIIGSLVITICIDVPNSDTFFFLICACIIIIAGITIILKKIYPVLKNKNTKKFFKALIIFASLFIVIAVIDMVFFSNGGVGFLFITYVYILSIVGIIIILKKIYHAKKNEVQKLILIIPLVLVFSCIVGFGCYFIWLMTGTLPYETSGGNYMYRYNLEKSKYKFMGIPVVEEFDNDGNGFMAKTLKYSNKPVIYLYKSYKMSDEEYKKFVLWHEYVHVILQHKISQIRKQEIDADVYACKKMNWSYLEYKSSCVQNHGEQYEEVMQLLEK